jgi:hypothetical protein
MNTGPWRSVVGFPAYEVSSTGIIRTKIGHVRLTSARNQGFQRVRLVLNGKHYDRRVNVVVLEAFIGLRPSPRHRCRYKDGDKTNFRANNLEWALRVPPNK